MNPRTQVPESVLTTPPIPPYQVPQAGPISVQLVDMSRGRGPADGDGKMRGVSRKLTDVEEFHSFRVSMLKGSGVIFVVEDIIVFGFPNVPEIKGEEGSPVDFIVNGVMT